MNFGPDEFSHRLATLAELPELERLMDASIRTFIGARLDAARVEASFDIMGVDTQLVEDGTYFVVECGDRIAGCGGWSRRATMFGGDHSAGRDARLLDPAAEPARVRAMYTHPDFARRGVGRLCCRCAKPLRLEKGFGRSNWLRPWPASRCISRAGMSSLSESMFRRRRA